MKKIIAGVLVLSVLIVTLVTKYHYPYLYMPIPKYWSVSDHGFTEIKEPDDFRLYYMDKMDAKGYDKNEIRYSALHQAYRNSENGSYVNISALMSLSYTVNNIEDKMYLQKRILDKHHDFDNRCYYDNCSSGHYVAGLAGNYARNLRKNGDLNTAYSILKEVYLARKYELQPWLRFFLLEEIYFTLNKKTITKNELNFFTKQIADMGPDFSDQKLADRYKNLLRWNQELQSRI